MPGRDEVSQVSLDATQQVGFTEFYVRTRKRVVCYAERAARDDHALAEDAVSEAYMTSMRHWAQLNAMSHGQQQKWINTVAGRKVVDLWRCLVIGAIDETGQEEQGEARPTTPHAG
jgi:DNA-directed RNA polymerase specialized sigma24 family protein